MPGCAKGIPVGQQVTRFRSTAASTNLCAPIKIAMDSSHRCAAIHACINYFLGAGASLAAESSSPRSLAIAMTRLLKLSDAMRLS